jgi:hypothetical protein
MAGYNSMQKFLTEKNLHFITFYIKADKLVEAIIRLWSGNISAEDNHCGPSGDRLLLHQCKTDDFQTCHSKRRGHTHVSLPFILVTLTRIKKNSRNFQIDNTL